MPSGREMPQGRIKIAIRMAIFCIDVLYMQEAILAQWLFLGQLYLPLFWFGSNHCGFEDLYLLWHKNLIDACLEKKIESYSNEKKYIVNCSRRDWYKFVVMIVNIEWIRPCATLSRGVPPKQFDSRLAPTESEVVTCLANSLVTICVSLYRNWKYENK